MSHPLTLVHLPINPRSFSVMLSMAELNAQRKMTERDILPVSGNDAGLWRKLKLSDPQSALAIAPSYFCAAELTRTASTATQYDGGKWLCGWTSLVGALSARTRKCIVYSFGSNFEPSFEKFVQAQTSEGCEVHVFDPTLYSRDHAKARQFAQTLQASGITLHDLGVAAPSEVKNLKSKTIPQLLTANGHTGACVDVLKLDVEGFELAILRETDWSQLCVGNLLLEIHGQNCERGRVRQWRARLSGAVSSSAIIRGCKHSAL